MENIYCTPSRCNPGLSCRNDGEGGRLPGGRGGGCVEFRRIRPKTVNIAGSTCRQRQKQLDSNSRFPRMFLVSPDLHQLHPFLSTRVSPKAGRPKSLNMTEIQAGRSQHAIIIKSENGYAIIRTTIASSSASLIPLSSFASLVETQP